MLGEAALTMGYIGQINQRTGPHEAAREVIHGASELTLALGGTFPDNANLQN